MSGELTSDAARDYIRIFAKHTLPGTDYVKFGDGAKISFSNMTAAVNKPGNP